MTKKKIKEITIANNTMPFEYLTAIIAWNSKKGVEISYQIENNNFTHSPRNFDEVLLDIFERENTSWNNVVHNCFYKDEVIEIKPKTFWQKLKYLFYD